MAERRVRTVEGARLFGMPIGSTITDRTSPEVDKTQRATSMVRLNSLKRQFAIAKKTGNVSAMRDIQEQFTGLLKDFSSTRQLIATIDDLVAQRGRNDQALGKRPDIND